MVARKNYSLGFYVYLLFAVLEMLNANIGITYVKLSSLALQVILLFCALMFSFHEFRKLLIFAFLICYGKWFYVQGGTEFLSFLGIKVLGVSLSFLLLMLSSLGRGISLNRTLLLVVGSLVFSTILSYSELYLDNFFKDLKTLSFFIIGFLTLKKISHESKYELLYRAIDISILMLFTSHLLGLTFNYAPGRSYLPVNSITFFTPSILLFALFSNSISVTRRLMWIIGTLVPIVIGQYFWGGKSLIMLILLIPLILVSVKPRNFYLLLFLIYVGSSLFLRFERDAILEYKLRQVTSIFEIDNLEAVKKSHTSVGNVLAEMDNLSLVSNKLKLAFGSGLGGGMQDQNGYLEQYSGEGGYSLNDKQRGIYFKMHLPLTEVMVKLGLIGLFFYLSVFFKIGRSSKKSIESWITFLSVALVFYVSKEMIVLTLISFSLAYGVVRRSHK